MMEELSMHVLDLLQNSISAGADRVEFYMELQPERDKLLFRIKDNGCGMSEEEIKKSLDPFYSSKNKRVGLGIPLLRLTAEHCEGKLEIKSKKGKGTEVFCEISLSHIDRPPVGDLAGTLFTTFVSYPEINFVFSLKDRDEEFKISTEEIKRELDGIPLNHPEVISFLKKQFYEGINRILKRNRII